jgi:thioredoxin 1
MLAVVTGTGMLLAAYSWLQKDYVVVLADDKSLDELIKNDRPILLEFYAKYCGPCQHMKLLVKQFARRRRDVTVAVIDAEHRAMVNRFGVCVTPTFFALEKGTGRIVGRQEGVCSMAVLERMINSPIVPLRWTRDRTNALP